jgi:hypothetical protein
MGYWPFLMNTAIIPEPDLFPPPVRLNTGPTPCPVNASGGEILMAGQDPRLMAGNIEHVRICLQVGPPKPGSGKIYQ